MTSQPYRPGDVVNGHVLGEDNEWHPVAPPPPAQAPPAPVTVVNVTRRGINHPLHAVLSLVTCGLWLPVWFVIWVADAARGD